MRIVYIGSGDFGLPCLGALRNSKHSLEFIVTQPARGAGRGRKTTKTAVGRWAEKNDTPFIETGDNSQSSVIEQVAGFNPDLIVVIAFGRKICNELIDLPPKGMINVHPSLLPRYRGAAPVNWAIIKGEAETGLTIATVTGKWDAGRIAAQIKTHIGDKETAEGLAGRLSSLSAPLLIETIDKIDKGSVVYIEQDYSKVTLAPKLKKSDGCIDFNAPAPEVRNSIRGLWPWPGACAVYVSKATGKSRRITFAMAELAHQGAAAGKDGGSLSPGTIGENLNVVCSPGSLRITQIRPAGGSMMSFEAFVNGHRVAPYDRFIKIEQ